MGPTGGVNFGLDADTSGKEEGRLAQKKIGHRQGVGSSPFPQEENLCLEREKGCHNDKPVGAMVGLGHVSFGPFVCNYVPVHT